MNGLAVEQIRSRWRLKKQKGSLEPWLYNEKEVSNQISEQYVITSLLVKGWKVNTKPGLPEPLNRGIMTYKLIKEKNNAKR
jgi:hypothetical protein